ncbi:hypothetical protein [Nocardiopsis baichengensis]|uniref:hypothetical protein n=1 Tax=Nocardiopsis baichengensis TaxID=280240 RepID=UPI00034A7F41|nr:hypothetical protein [Nocardiopsis baichengensis]
MPFYRAVGEFPRKRHTVFRRPDGFTHGPRPGAVEEVLGARATTGTPVMVDTFRPLETGPAGRASEGPACAWSRAR